MLSSLFAWAALKGPLQEATGESAEACDFKETRRQLPGHVIRRGLQVDLLRYSECGTLAGSLEPSAFVRACSKCPSFRAYAACVLDDFGTWG